MGIFFYAISFQLLVRPECCWTTKVVSWNNVWRKESKDLCHRWTLQLHHKRKKDWLERHSSLICVNSQKVCRCRSGHTSCYSTTLAGGEEFAVSNTTEGGTCSAFFYFIVMYVIFNLASSNKLYTGSPRYMSLRYTSIQFYLAQ